MINDLVMLSFLINYHYSAPEILSKQRLHQLDVALPVPDIYSLESSPGRNNCQLKSSRGQARLACNGSPVVHGVHLANHLGGDAEEITSVDTQPVIFCLNITQ